MDRIDETELKEIIDSYGLDELIFDTFKQVEPDTALYFFHDRDNTKYCLITSDYLDNNIKLPCDFKYDYYPDNIVEFRAIRIFSYVENAKKKAEGYIDDNHYRTMASTGGGVCMLFAIDKLKI
ncbi:hypothetical protein IKG33_02260 [Candidatus Saccharibacteria bacterium]|nr:hypothetical protein [Candidatus Saccharibacteria bacterium]